ncbi:hypothetical protein PV10_08018 [Exophiala mesophila]|uniref:37S ribosomal protein Rsm22 n=1 Tax=Exophiala mesophila TaxID=212818 RepID=A0A0D1WHM6_EXOME|nr:uncharacterized protein PV10_08018 [Exophiala mesophila]KIV88325.1 hypothetical protein PV10_08018 [Exophiala mesophila]
MISRIRVARLCSACRYDLQNVFETAFSNSAPALTTLSRPRQRLKSPRPSIRPYTQAASRLTQQSAFEPNDSAEAPLTNDHISSGLYARLERLIELERRVDEAERRFYDQHIDAGEDETDVNEAETDDQGYPHPLTTQRARDLLVQRAQGLVATLRTSGASPEAIAREARQIFGETLPSDVLDEQETKIYTRFYGEPVLEPFGDEEEDAGYVDSVLEPGTMRLFDENGQPVELDDVEEAELTLDDEGSEVADAEEVSVAPGPKLNFATDQLPPTLMVSHLQRLEEIARNLDGEVVEEDSAAQEEELQEAHAKLHPFTRLGKFASSPGNVLLPRERFVTLVEEIMTRYSNKHLKEICEKTFGGPGLPDSPLTPRSGRSREQVPIPLAAADHNMGEMEANAFITTVMPPTYASIMSVLVETRKRLGPTWLNNLLAKEGGPRVLDAGAGGAGILAWRELIQAHWSTLHSSDQEPPAPPATKSVVLTGSHTLRHRAAELLDNTTFIPRLPDYAHLREGTTLEDDRPDVQRKQFDVIIAPHMLFGLKEEFMRREMVQNLWSMLSSDGGILIIIEKGIPRGFEAVAAARDLLLHKYIAIPEGRTTHYSNAQDDSSTSGRKPGMIVAPCTNHEQCPMYLVPGKSHGRKDWCAFQQRYTRPSYLQRVLGARDRNHDDVDFSYISVMKGDDLRNRKIQAWEGLEDALAAPSIPGAQGEGVQGQAWMRQAQIGFEEVEPKTTLEDFNSMDANRGALDSMPAPWNLPRLIMPALKRKQHIIMDVCTPHGRIERWTVPKSFGKQAYHDARKIQWGDLWALGAKTRIDRGVKVGRPDSKEGNKARRQESLRENSASLQEELDEDEIKEMLEAAGEEPDLEDIVDGGEIRKRQDPTEARSRKREALRLKKEHRSGGKGAKAELKSSKGAGGIFETFSFGMDESQAREIDPTIGRRVVEAKANGPPRGGRARQEVVKPGGRRPGLLDEIDALSREQLDLLQDWGADLVAEDPTKIRGGRPPGRLVNKFGGGSKLRRRRGDSGDSRK